MPAPVTPQTEAPLVELFSSIQGEGVLVGCRQVFLRFADCNLDCRYCDTDFQRRPQCQVEIEPGSGLFEPLDNPVDLQRVTTLLRSWQQQSPGLHHSLSLTGGEPLLHAECLRAWLPGLRSVLPVHLETNGTLATELGLIVPWLNWVSMDIKTPSTAGMTTPWSAHADFIAAAAEKLCQVKVVVDEQTELDEVEAIAGFLTERSARVPLILQPRTSQDKVSVSPDHLLRLQEAAARLFPDVRVIPQLHVFMQLL